MNKWIIYCCLLSGIFSCEDQIVEENTYENVFETFWTIMDEHYIYFIEKDIKWDSIYFVYEPIAKIIDNDEDLEEMFKEVLYYFQDRHVLLVKPDGTFIVNSNKGFDNGVGFPPPEKYGFSNYLYKVPEFYTVEHADHGYGYVSIKSLHKEFPLESLKYAMSIFNLNYHNGLIVDLRYCEGGNFSSVRTVSSLFYSNKKTLFYEKHKTGTGHTDFGELRPFINKGLGIIHEDIPLIVLIDSANYSAVNLLAFILDELPNSITVGTTTSGGGGTIASVDLPNGWILNYPYLKLISASGDNMELGLEPDVYHYFNPPEDFNGEYDSNIAIALELLDSINGYEKVYYFDR